MEFFDLIKTPKLDGVIMCDTLQNKIEGTLCITSHHLIISSRKTMEFNELVLLHSMIDVVERRPNSIQTGGILVLKCKNFRILTIEINGWIEFLNIATSIELLSNLNEPRLFYPYFYNPEFQFVENGWEQFKIENEFANLTHHSDEWRLSTVNKNFEICRTYPETVIVPKTISDDCLRSIAQFRCLGRFPVLSYYHRPTKKVLLRSGQPMVGTSSKRCKDDEKLINTVLGVGKRGFIIETRTKNLSQLARNKGGGFELEMHYPLWTRVNRNIDRHSTLLDSLGKLIESCMDQTLSMDKWLSRLETSGWLSHIKDVLSSACLVAQCLDQDNVSVLVHGSEGMDSTLQVCSLTQIILNPDCRNIYGFEALIEREWLQAGHPFATRCKHSAYTIPSARTREQSPIFLAFLDCVYQIYQQFPCSFEFNEKFLILLFENSYSSQFGTFLGDCQRERMEMNLAKKTCSLWSYINRPEILKDYLNPLYEPNSSILWPSVAPQSLELWKGMYLHRIAMLIEEESTLKHRAIKLRRLLQNLQQQQQQPPN
ncbi:Myotubularin- protein 9 [Dermatophagoides pteronyssinus]|uniref:Myotubularin- protein 9 n=1 Tax=Dermatophagoides pteronyssinus TaxID=6956 RepID=A0ABQ8JWG9_DERPT|nr:Myotubularin- protein 9 [Dermatophagoides pteronyssinus]